MKDDRRAAPAGPPAVARATGTALATIPEQLQEIADLVGQGVVLAIIAAKGGSEVNIPRRAGPDHWLSRLVGAETAERICAHYRVLDADGHEPGRLRIYVPLANTGVLTRARAELVRGLEQGLTVRDAARRANLSERTAHRLLGRIPDPRQGDLFAPRGGTGVPAA